MTTDNVPEKKTALLVTHYGKVARLKIVKPYFYVRSGAQKKSWKYRQDLITPLARFENLDVMALSELTTHFTSLDLFPDVEYFGFLHYRRFLDFSYFPNQPVTDSERWVIKILERKQLEATLAVGLNNLHSLLLKENTLILPIAHIARSYRGISTNSAYEHFTTAHPNLTQMLDESLKLLDLKLEQEIGTSKNFLQGTNKAYYHNMFIGSRDFVEEYDRIFFPIFVKMNKFVQDNGLESQIGKSRWFGFIAERLFTCFVENVRNRKKFTIVEIPMIRFQSEARTLNVLNSILKIKKFFVKKEFLADKYINWESLGKK